MVIKMKDKRPEFPKRAVVTAGMPYGNKELHFGHIGGVFIHADVFARFLRDRIGGENVVFVSGTDCYGATIEASYEQRKGEGFEGSLIDFVRENHMKQKEVLDKYEISLNLFAASALDEPGKIHSEISKQVFDELYDKGCLSLEKTLQFYDEEAGVFLNGRQVTGRCPIQGCKSESAYADECSLGHQYNPAELIAPVSVLSGKRPSLVFVENWYFDLVKFSDLLKERNTLLAGDSSIREGLTSIIGEFLKKPGIYVKKEFLEGLDTSGMPAFTVNSEANKTSDELIFESLADRDAACKYLADKGVRYRTGKTLVPFRISGNVAWGIPVPEKEGAGGTFWVWPESLWAPISFTEAYLRSSGKGWEDYWKSKDSKVYQFIGEDNIYFYGIAEMGIFMALQDKPTVSPEDGQMQLPSIIANHHLLYMDKKASSSSALKPPKAGELLNYYTPEQLRIHFMNASLGTKSISFKPKAFMDQQNNKDFDAVLYEGNLLTNIYNRLIRSCFYTNQKYFGKTLPAKKVSARAKNAAEETILAYERHMAKCELDKVFELINIYLREANKYFSGEMKKADAEEDNGRREEILADSFYAVRVAASLLHPIAPSGCEMVRAYMNMGESMWSWDHIFETLTEDCHEIKFLEPRIDFFPKHPSQG